MILTAPCQSILLPVGVRLSHSRLTHPVPLGKEDGRSCKKVTIRMTIRKNECRSNTPVRGTHKMVGGSQRWDGGVWGVRVTQTTSQACSYPGEPGVL